MPRRSDPAVWLLPACAVLTLSGVGLLVPRRAVQAAPPATKAAPMAPMAAYDDGDGDELLEHWGDPKYVREERIQMAGVAAGFVLLGGLTWRKRARRQAQPTRLQLVTSNDLKKAA